MTEDRLDKLINSARETYRVPPSPQLDEMWRAIDAELDERRGIITPVVQQRPRDWRVAGLAAAAALMIGVGLGRWSAPVAVSQPAVVATVSEDTVTGDDRLVSLAEPLQRTASNYFGETAALLKDVQNNPQGAYARQASTLLTTTRLLLDSPAASDKRLHDLLEDLEVTFAQIAMLPASRANGRKAEDLALIRNALEERALVPRVHTAVVTLASSDED